MFTNALKDILLLAMATNLFQDKIWKKSLKVKLNLYYKKICKKHVNKFKHILAKKL